MTKKEDEMIMCFRKDDMLLEDGSMPNATFIAKATTAPGIAMMKRRGDIEKDTTFVQPIPYTIIMAPKGGEGDDADEANFLIYKRSKKGGETRLQDQYSVGVGGHINMVDVYSYMAASDDSYANPVMPCALRELMEELGVSELNCDNILMNENTIYDPTEEVSSVHVGIHLCITLHEKPVINPEDALVEVNWVTIDQLSPDGEYYDKMEGWSKWVVDYMRQSLMASE